MALRIKRMLGTIGQKGDGASDETLRSSRGVEDGIETGGYKVFPAPLLT